MTFFLKNININVLLFFFYNDKKNHDCDFKKMSIVKQSWVIDDSDNCTQTCQANGYDNSIKSRMDQCLCVQYEKTNYSSGSVEIFFKII